MVSKCSAHDSWLSTIVPGHFTLCICSLGSQYKFKFIFGVDDSLWLDPKIIDLVFEMFSVLSNQKPDFYRFTDEQIMIYDIEGCTEIN